MKKPILMLMLFVSLFAVSSCDDWDDLPENERLIESLLYQRSTSYEVHVTSDSTDFYTTDFYTAELAPAYRFVIVEAADYNDTIPGKMDRREVSTANDVYFEELFGNSAIEAIFGYVAEVESLRKDLMVDSAQNVTYYGYKVVAVEDVAAYKLTPIPNLVFIWVTDEAEEHFAAIETLAAELGCKTVRRYGYIVASLPLGLKAFDFDQICYSRIPESVRCVDMWGLFRYQPL